jgi:flagellin
VATATTAASVGDFQAIVTSASNFINSLSTQRGVLGATQNQMEYSINNITELSANLSSARSRVIDTDYATETAKLTKGQILQQAATAMLAQANQMPNVILSLLK